MTSNTDRYDTLFFYRSGLRRQWRWRYRSCSNYKKLANGGEGYVKFSDAVTGAFRVCGLELDFDLSTQLVGVHARQNGTKVRVIVG